MFVKAKTIGKMKLHLQWMQAWGITAYVPQNIRIFGEKLQKNVPYAYKMSFFKKDTKLF